jgi:hypothetical protein
LALCRLLSCVPIVALRSWYKRIPHVAAQLIHEVIHLLPVIGIEEMPEFVEEKRLIQQATPFQGREEVEWGDRQERMDGRRPVTTHWREARRLGMRAVQPSYRSEAQAIGRRRAQDRDGKL